MFEQTSARRRCLEDCQKFFGKETVNGMWRKRYVDRSPKQKFDQSYTAEMEGFKKGNELDGAKEAVKKVQGWSEAFVSSFVAYLEDRSKPPQPGQVGSLASFLGSVNALADGLFGSDQGRAAMSVPQQDELVEFFNGISEYFERLFTPIPRDQCRKTRDYLKKKIEQVQALFEEKGMMDQYERLLAPL